MESVVEMRIGEFNGDRLRQARRFRRKTITDLADEIGVTKQMVSRYEHGNATPGTDTMFKLVHVLDFPGNYFYQQDNFRITSTGTFFRSRLTSTQTEKQPSEYLKNCVALIRNYLEQYIDFPKLICPKISTNSPAIAAGNLRKQWGLKNLPIKNMVELLETHGFTLGNVNGFSDKVDAFSSDVGIKHEKEEKDYYCILIEGSNFSFYRQQFSLAHELGHWLLHDKKNYPQEMDRLEYKKMEQEANEFAANFLLPTNNFKEDSVTANSDINYFVNLKTKWNVSLAALLMRAHNLEVINDDDYNNLQRKVSYRGWRKVEPFDRSKQVPKAVALKQAIELLVENDLLSPAQMLSEIQQQYQISLPMDVIEAVTGVQKGYFQARDGKIVSLNHPKTRKVNK
jgi:Zn-dependent peptidase ImmA (M78 family)/DNA-binding XRE family transcriptional regulator